MESFKKMGLSDGLLKAIEEMGFENPTPVQGSTIPAILESNEDLVALAQTGTGKTAAFGLPILQQIDLQSNSVQAIILCPTRELCIQIAKEIERFAKYIKQVSYVAVYGGANISEQIREIKKGAQIIVGTPGRTLDLKKRGVLKLESIKWLVLDEADEMLNMGFKDELDAILETTPAERQTLLFSATMPKGVMNIAQNYMQKPREISVGKRNEGAVNVEHHYYTVKASDKYKAVKRISDINPDIYGIVFCRTRQETKDLASKLMQDGYNAGAIHGDLSQAQRDEVMGHFRERNLKLLVATDVAARGIDVTDLTHIINYNLPDDPEVYVHRSGRTGRAGKNGISIAIVHSREKGRLKSIERIANIQFQHKLIPGVDEICKKRVFSFIDRMEKTEIGENQVQSILPEVYKKLELMDREEIINRFITLEFGRFLDYYKNEKDINVSRDERGSENRRDRDRGSENRRDRGSDSRRDRGSEKNRERSNSKRSHSDRNLSRFFINIGSKQDIKAHNIIGLVNEKTGNASIEIGKIEILKNFSFFEADKSFESSIIDSMNGSKRGSVELKVELSTPKKDDSSFRGGGSDTRKKRPAKRKRNK